MSGGVSNVGRLNIFISYSREDLEFADQLAAALGLHDFEISIDRLSISGGEDWKQRLGGLILSADTVVFILSPASAASAICQWEVDEAIRLGKRIIPVVCRPLGNTVPPQQLASLNYILFYADPKAPGSGFGSGLARLVVALNTDLDWLREHTRLLQRATEWNTVGRAANRLLSGNDIALARQWVAQRPKEAPAPSDLQLDFIRASEAREVEQQSAERERLRQVAEAQEAREVALRDKEASQRREAESQKRETDLAKRFARRTLVGLVVALVLATLAVGFGVYARLQTRAALASRNEALLTQSKFLTDQAHREIDAGDTTNGLLLALEALPDADSDQEAQRARPYWPAAQIALDAAVRSMKERVILPGHIGPVHGVVMSPDGTRIISVSEDRTVRVWDTKTGTQHAVFRGHSSSILSLAVTSDGGRIVTASADGTARVWDTRTGATLTVLTGNYSIVSSVAVTPDGARVITGAEDGLIKIWDATTGIELGTLRGHTKNVSSLAVSRDGKRIISGSEDGTVRIWDSRTGDELFTSGQLGGLVTSICVTPDEKAIVIGLGNGLVGVWNFRTDNVLLTFKADSILHSLTITPDGTTIVTASRTGSRDGLLGLWDVNTGRALAKFTVAGAGAETVTVTPDGGRLVAGYDDGTIRIWDADPDTGWMKLKGNTESVSALTLTPDATRVVTGFANGSARIWQVKTGRQLVELKGHTARITSIAVTPDSARIVTASEDRTARVWDAQTGAQLVVLKYSLKAVTQLAVTPDGTRVITDGAGFGRVWDIKTGAELVELNPSPNRLQSGGGLPTSISVTPDSTRVVIGYSNGTARVWDIRTGAVVAELKGRGWDKILSITVFPDGKRILTTSEVAPARIWDAQTGAELLVLKGSTRAVIGTVVMPDGKWVITGSSDGTARVWNAQTGDEVSLLSGHMADIISVAATPDGKQIVTGSLDGTIRVWDIGTGMELARLETHAEGLSNVAVSPDGTYVVTSSSDNTVRIWQLLPTGADLIKQARIATPRCLGPSDRQSYNLASEMPSWCVEAGKWPAGRDALGAISEALRLEEEHKNQQADAAFAQALTKYPQATEAISAAWAQVYLYRGGQLQVEGADAEAIVQFNKAIALDPSLADGVEIARGVALSSRINQLVDKGELADAKALAEKLIDANNVASLLVELDVAFDYFNRSKFESRAGPGNLHGTISGVSA